MKSLRIAVTVLMAMICLGVGGRAVFLMVPSTTYAPVERTDPPVVRPIFDEDFMSSREPLTRVLETYIGTVPYYVDEFKKVLRSRLRHRQFRDLETYAAEIRRTKARF